MRISLALVSMPGAVVVSLTFDSGPAKKTYGGGKTAYQMEWCVAPLQGLLKGTYCQLTCRLLVANLAMQSMELLHVIHR